MTNDARFAAILAEESWGAACTTATNLGCGWWHFADKVHELRLALRLARRPWWKKLLG